MKKKPNKNRKIFIVLLFLSLFLGAFYSCSKEQNKNQAKLDTKQSPAPIDYDLKDIIDSGVLRVITTYSPTGYFLYKTGRYFCDTIRSVPEYVWSKIASAKSKLKR